jgi:hypothetical protein
VAYGAFAPLEAQQGRWQKVDGDVVLAAATAPDAERAQVVWMRSGVADSTFARLLLDYYRAGRTSARTPQPRLDLGQECALLRESTAPTVLTDEPASVAAARYDCVSQVGILELAERS